MINAVEELIKAGTLKREDVLRYIELIEDDADVLHNCARLMHTLLCKAMTHEQRLETVHYDLHNVCYWYAEEVLDSRWEEPAHLDWLKRCGTQMRYLDMNSVEDFREFLNRFAIAASNIESLIALHPSAKGLFRELLT